MKHGQLKVVYVIPGPETGPGFIFAKREFRLVSERFPGSQVFYLNTRSGLVGLFGQLFSLRRIVKSVRPDVVHAQYGTLTAFIAALSLRGSKFVITFRGSDLNPKPGPPRFRHFLARVLSHLSAYFADHCIFVSEELSRRVLIRKSRKSVIPTGVDTRLFFPRSIKEARRNLGWNGEDVVILFNAGSNPVNKRLDLAEATAQRLGKALHGRRVVLHVTRGQTPPDQMPVLMCASNLLLMLSDYEGSPTVVQEALACGTPIVSVPVGDVHEVLDAVPGCKIVPRDLEHISDEALNVVLSNRRAEPNRAKLEDISLESCVNRISLIYKKIAKNAERNLCDSCST